MKPIRSDLLPPDPGTGTTTASLHYGDTLPEVETTIHVLDCSSVNLVASSFDLDFVVVLDWLDPQLVENVHFGAGNNAGPNGSKFRLLDAVATDPAFFNPEIKVDNGLAVELVEGEDSNSRVPRIKKVLMVPEAGEVQSGLLCSLTTTNIPRVVIEQCLQSVLALCAATLQIIAEYEDRTGTNETRTCQGRPPPSFHRNSTPTPDWWRFPG